jgi:hypothetical protein
MKTFKDFRDKHRNEDIYVLGSGPTLNHIPPRFWDNKTIVAVNHGALRMMNRKPDYMVTKYHHHALEYLEEHPESTIVVTRYNTGNHNEPGVISDPRLVVLEHPHNTCEKWSIDQWPPVGQFLATYSSITTAMHWAAHLGAANIVLAGHDCGWVDEEGRVPGYRVNEDGTDASDTDNVFWRSFNSQSIMVKQGLQDRYGCTVTSVNPWINLNLEGHTWRGVTR